jgi:FlaG/FlaF family flagellin (archaellin)
MPLQGTPSLNVTMKAGTTISADKLTAWQDTVNLHEYTPLTDGTTTAEAPATNVESLNGFPVATFNGVDTALSFDDPAYERREGSVTGILVKHFVIKISNTNDFYFNYIENSANAIYGNATLLNTDSPTEGIQARGGPTGSPIIDIPKDEWFIYTEITDDDNSGRPLYIYINKQKEYENLTEGIAVIEDTGSTLGARNTLSFFAEFSIAQMTQYILPTGSGLTEQQIQDNILFLMSEWDLVPAPLGVITHKGQPVEGAVVTYLQADPANVSNVDVSGTWVKQITDATILGQSITNALGEHEYTGESFDDTKLLGIAVHYKYWDGVKWVERSKTEWSDLNLDLSAPV